MANRGNNKRDEFEIKFLNYELTAQQDEEFDAWLAKNQASLNDLIGGFIASGWKCSIGWNEQRQAFTSSATCVNERNRNYGGCLTSFSDDYTEAVLLNIFKVNIVFGGKEIKIEKSNKRRG